MTLTRYRLGDLIKIVNEKNDLGIRRFYGININKEIMPTNAKTENLNEKKYKLLRKNRFVYSGMQTGRDKSIRISMYFDDAPVIVSPAYTTFEIKDENVILPIYLFMLFQSEEKDRLGWFYSDSSVRANLDWDRFCDIKIELPPLDVQKKYVAIYKAMLENQESYEKSLEDLKFSCDAALDIVFKKYNPEYLGDFIKKSEEKNTENNFNKSHIRGISIDKKFIDTKANLGSVNVKNYKIVKPNEFAFVTVTSRNSEKISLAMNQSNNVYLCSSTYMVFKVIDNSILNPSYLLLNFNKKQFDRYVRFNSWGSARETFDYSDMEQVKIPVPPIEVQNSIANIYKVYTERKKINEKLKERLKNICPILIKGAVEEAKRKEA